jgi:uncharacterized ion transporter superfamily protein YfcC
MDLVIPTNGALMATLAIAGVSFEDWFKFIVKRLAVLYLLSALALFIAILIGI